MTKKGTKMEALVGTDTEIKLCNINIADIEIEQRIIDIFKYDNRAMENVNYDTITKAEVIIVPDIYNAERVPYSKMVHSMSVKSVYLRVVGGLTDGTEEYNNHVPIGVNDFVFINSGKNMF